MKVSSSCPVSASHTLAIPLPTVTMRRLSAKNATELTLPVCLRVSSSRPVSASQTFAVLSLLPVTISRLSGEKATDLIEICMAVE